MNEEQFKQLFKDNILKTIQITLENIVLNCDKTVQGRIVSVEPNNKYVVAIQGAVYTVPCINSNTYTVNQAVWVTLPQGDWDSAFILGMRVM